MYALLLYKPRNDIYPICTIPEIAVGRKAAFSDILLRKRHTVDEISPKSLILNEFKISSKLMFLTFREIEIRITSYKVKKFSTKAT